MRFRSKEWKYQGGRYERGYKRLSDVVVMGGSFVRSEDMREGYQTISGDKENVPLNIKESTRLNRQILHQLKTTNGSPRGFPSRTISHNHSV